MQLKIGRRFAFEVANLAQAVSTYEMQRDLSNEGASTFPSGVVRDGKKIVAHVSYNGRLWEKPPGSADNSAIKPGT